MADKTDVAIIGGGIVRLAHAWAAARDGRSVVVFEKDDRAVGASIRNFGMIWPVGQTAGQMHSVAMASRKRWCELAKEAGFWLNECGSIHLAHRDDELQVLEEFCTQAPSRGYECKMLSASEVMQQSDAANPTGLLGGLWSPSEMCVDPREVIQAIPRWLERSHGVQFRYGTQIRRVDSREIETANGDRMHAEKVIVASGSDFRTLFPEILAQSGMTLCKLQMLRTVPQKTDRRIGPHLASGLTLRHYKNFETCESLDSLKKRIANESPQLDKFGIHVMAAQNQIGEVILGDSHEYGNVGPFRKQEIDNLMLAELQKIIRLEDWTIAERWSGVYSKHPTLPYFENNPHPNVKIVTGLGGAGMTLSFGLADKIWTDWQ